MRISLEKRIPKTPILRLACSLDFKFKGDPITYSSVDGMMEGIRDFYKTFPNSNENRQTATDLKSASSMTETSSSGKKTAFSELFGARFAKRSKPDHESDIECELISYLALRNPDHSEADNVDSFQWSKDHQHTFPKLSAIAKKLLCIVATSAPAERIFSVAGNIITAQRSNIATQNVDRMIFLYENLEIS